MIRAEAVRPPVITDVAGPLGSFPNGGTTEASYLVVIGTAPSQDIEIYDGEVQQGIVDTSGAETWVFSASGLAVGTHSFPARAEYGEGQVSPARALIVAGPLAIDTSTRYCTPPR